MSSEGGRSAQGAGGFWPPPKHAWIAGAGVMLVLAGHMAYGAIVSDVALTLGAAAAALVAACLFTPALRADLLRLKGLAVPGLLFAAVLAIGVWSLTPYVPGGPHPIWSYVGLKGAATVDRSATIVELVKLLGLACFFLVGAAAGARDERARFAVQLTVLLSALFGLWAIFVAATGAIYQTAGHRLEALFLNPNTAGNVFAALFVLSVASLWREIRARRGRSLSGYGAWVAATILGVALLNTASRGAASAALTALALYFVLQLANGGMKLTWGLTRIFGALALLGLLVIFAGDVVVERLFQAEADAEIRLEAWELHWAAFLRAPLFGYGLGAFEPINRSLLTAGTFETLFSLRAPLNVYLQWLEEGGVLMAAPMFLCIGLLIALTLRGLFRRTRMTGLLAGLLAVDVTFLIHGLTDSALQTPSVAAFWAWILGLQLALAEGSSRR